MSFFDQQRVRLLDRLVLLSISVSFPLIFIDAITKLYALVIVNAIATFGLFIPILWLQSKGRYALARVMFMLGTTVIITAATIYSFQFGRFNEVENILTGFSAISIFLFDKRRKVIAYLGYVFLVIWLKWYRDIVILDKELVDFYLTTINTIILFIAVYFFVEIYREALQKELLKSNELNQELLNEKKEVERTRGMLYNMIDNIPLFLAMMDKDGNFLAMNKQFAAAMGMDERYMMGQNYQDLLPQLMIDQMEVRLREGLRGSEAEFDEPMTFPNGGTIQVFGQIVPLFNDMGVYGLTMFMADVGDLKEKELKLQQLNDTKNKLFSIIAHDLKNPINLLQGLVHISNDGGFEEDEQEIFIDRIQKNLGSVNHMMENLLLWARSQLDGYKIDKSICMMYDEFLLVWKIYKENALKKGINLESKIPKNHQVLMDRNHLQMILRNLLNNAIKFTPEGGSINIKTQKRNGSICLEISDTGKGMDEATQQAILKGQFVHSEYGTEGESGTGLGLSLCTEMLYQNNGQLELESVEGEGTTFRLLIPTV
jgi:PAS domain S-box-containing protein